MVRAATRFALSLACYRPSVNDQTNEPRVVGVWDHERGAVGGTTSLPPHGWLTRPGDPETRADLEADAARASQHGYPHGVSVRLRPSRPTEGRAAAVGPTVARFQLLKTGEAADHFTVAFDGPVSEADADAFSALFVPVG